MPGRWQRLLIAILSDDRRDDWSNCDGPSCDDLDILTVSKRAPIMNLLDSHGSKWAENVKQMHSQAFAISLGPNVPTVTVTEANYRRIFDGTSS